MPFERNRVNTRDDQLNPEDFVSFVEPDPCNSGPKAIAYTIKIRPAVERRWRRHCDSLGIDRMLAIRDCFAIALANTLGRDTRGETDLQDQLDSVGKPSDVDQIVASADETDEHIVTNNVKEPLKGAQ